jgi:hypothetical protein
MRRFFLGAGLLGATFFLGGTRQLLCQQQTSSPSTSKSDQGKSAPKSGAKPDPANTVPDAPQPQKEPANNSQDSSSAPADPAPPSESGPESAPSSGKDVPPQRAPDTSNKPSTSNRSTESDNPFPEDVSRHAAQQETQASPAAPASSGEKPASPHNAAGDNPFPEDISRKAAKASADPDSASDGASQGNPPKVPLPLGVSSSQSSALPDPTQTRHALGIVSATRAKKDTQVGDFYLAQGNFKGAYERYKDSIAYDPTNVDAIFGIAEASKGLKQFAEAQHNYLLYLDILPNGPKAKQALKALTAIQGKQ